MTTTAPESVDTGLSPSRALGIFVASLVVSIALLFATDVVWLSLLPVFFYGSLLWFRQRRDSAREFTSTVKDSPYFLGFILTLLGLFKVFVAVGAQRRDATGQIDINQLVGQAGGAILATVVGLFFRQVLWSHDKFENRRETIFQELTGSLRDQAVEYRAQQSNLVSLLTEFIESRRRLLAEDETVQSRYLRHLEQTSKILEDFTTEYPAKVSAVLDGLTKAGGTITQASDDFASSMRTASSELSETFSIQAAQFVATVSAATGPINQAGRGLAQSVVEFDSILGDGGKKIADSLDRFATTVGETPQSLKATAASLESLRENAKGLEDSVLQVVSSANSINSAVADLVKGLASDTNAVHVEIQRRAEVLAADMQEVDRAFDELLALMRRRLQAADIRLRTDGADGSRNG